MKMSKEKALGTLLCVTAYVDACTIEKTRLEQSTDAHLMFCHWQSAQGKSLQMAENAIPASRSQASQRLPLHLDQMQLFMF
jgi:hypothetical protein